MVVKPKFRGFICTTAHPAGCAQNVMEQINYVKAQPALAGPKRALVIGASTGYGLASRIVSTFGAKAATIGVFLEKPALKNKTASSGWYNTAAFEEAAHAEGYYAKSINGDAFSQEIKRETAELIKKDLGAVDLVVYSLAAPRRTHPLTGETFSSVLKPIGQTVTSKTLDIHTGEITETTIEPASEEEIKQTVAVMGGEDWRMWIDALRQAGVLAPAVVTVAYSYIGPEITRFVYRDGTIGRAKEDLEATAGILAKELRQSGGQAYVSVNKALVTQASAAIPVVPLYVSLLYKVMKEKGIHEGCIQQIYRLFQDRLYSAAPVPPVDEEGRIRLDDWEMRDDVQAEVAELWEKVNSENIRSLSDVDGYKRDFFNLFGFACPGIDYDQEVEIEKAIPSLKGWCNER
ncbi:MAG TPA: enoyl-ACP reductase FabV [Bacillota bacterium]